LPLKRPFFSSLILWNGDYLIIKSVAAILLLILLFVDREAACTAEEGCYAATLPSSAMVVACFERRKSE
jgi:hypothetical protein